MRYIFSVDESQTIALHKIDSLTIPIDSIQKIIKGFFEIVHITPDVKFPVKDAVMLVNDCGYLECMKPNFIASTLYGYEIVGPIILCKTGYTEDGPDIVSLTYEDIEAIWKWAKEDK
jgi:hypothetical protein